MRHACGSPAREADPKSTHRPFPLHDVDKQAKPSVLASYGYNKLTDIVAKDPKFTLLQSQGVRRLKVGPWGPAPLEAPGESRPG